MDIYVNTDKNISGNQELKDRYAQIVDSTLIRFNDNITRVEVHLNDENSDKKTGQRDKKCNIEAHLKGFHNMSATDFSHEVEAAVAGAAEKLKNALESFFGKLKDQQYQQLVENKQL